MYCSKCGSKLDQEAQFCKSCGEKVSKLDSNLFPTYDQITDEDLKKAYVGPNYEKIKKDKFSIPTFFFGAYYLFYRKMWLYAILWILMVILVNICTLGYDIPYISMAPFVVGILFSIYFGKLYLNTVDKRINLIKQRNSSKTQKEILEECRKQGGVSVLAVILSIVLITILIISLLTIFFFAFFIDKIDEQENIEKNEVSELYYTVPNIFEQGSYSNDFSKSFHYYGDTDSCSLTITVNQVFSSRSEEDYLKSSIITSMDSQVSNILQQEINGEVWKYVEVVDSTKKTYYYASIYQDKIYQFQYTIFKDDYKLCSTGYTNFTSSLMFQNKHSHANQI